MVSSELQNQVSDVKLSSVVPGKMSGDGKVLELGNMDLAMKLHYVKSVYYFNSEAATGLGIYELKPPLFHLLELYYKASGRVRRAENGRPVIKCNDSGVRVVEANCGISLKEFLDKDDHSFADWNLVYSNAIGPDLGFSPLVFIQFTRFKCGGLAVGLSWAHILGDAFSASTFVRIWAQMISAHSPLHVIPGPNITPTGFTSDPPRTSRSLKKVEPVGDYWVTPNNLKMETCSLHISSKQLDKLLSGFSEAQPFEAISALFWKTLATIRGESEPKVVTICTDGCGTKRSQNEMISCNSQVVSTVEADFVVANSDVSELAKLVSKNRVDENGVIEGLVAEAENEQMDFVVYGGNLTFVDLESVDIYGVELKGYKAVFANFSISGVGDEGAILVLPAPKNYKNDCGEGRIVTMVLPEYEIPLLKNHIKTEFALF